MREKKPIPPLRAKNHRQVAELNGPSLALTLYGKAVVKRIQQYASRQHLSVSDAVAKMTENYFDLPRENRRKHHG